MRKLIFAALLAGTASTPAFAQDVPAFTGFHIEAIGGYDTLRSGDRDDDGVDTGENEGDESIDGAVFGVGAGYDFNIGSLVLGVEGEYTESTGEQEADESLDGINFTSSVETGRDIYVGARVGVQAGPSTLVYAKAGYTNTSIEAGLESDDETFEFDTNVDGWRLGAGIEQRFGENMFGRLEYRYSNYNNLDFSDDFDFEDFDPEDFDTDIDLDRHQVVAAVGFRF